MKRSHAGTVQGLPIFDICLCVRDSTAVRGLARLVRAFFAFALNLLLLSPVLIMRAARGSAFIGRYDETVPGDLDTWRKEALGIGMTRLVRQMNQVGATRPHSFDDVDCLRKT